MNLAVTVEHRFERTPDGRVWTWSPYPRSFWRTHLNVFDSVRVVGRVREVEAVPPYAEAADGPGVSFLAIPHYLGPAGYLRQATKIRGTIREAAGSFEAVLLRVPSAVAGCVHRVLKTTSHPYGIEVLGDPFDVFGPGAVSHPLRAYFRWRFCRDLRRQCSGAEAVCYVTRESLQQRYPVRPDALSVHCSDVQLPAEAFAAQGRTWRKGSELSLITVASLEQPYKGVDILIDAVRDCLHRGCDIRLTVVGGGRHLGDLQVRAADLAGRVRFTGQVRSQEVRAELDKADLFVLPSRCEGLPKAILEAMARGLPCLASSVGGMPELLPPGALVPPGDRQALADSICRVTHSPEEISAQAERNLAVAREYSEDVLVKRQIHFYRHLREVTERMLHRSGSRTSAAEAFTAFSN